MPRATWPLRGGRPAIELVLTLAVGGQKIRRILLADTGAGSDQAPFELILDEDDCLLCHITVMRPVQLSGAYSGQHPIYGIPVEIPQLSLGLRVDAVGVSKPPADFDGIAGFRFLNRFTYGNFGDPNQFGLES